MVFELDLDAKTIIDDDMEIYDDESWDCLEWDAFKRRWGLYESEEI